jgi:ribonuclease HI
MYVLIQMSGVNEVEESRIRHKTMWCLGVRVSGFWVSGQSGVEENEKYDELAKMDLDSLNSLT